MTTESFLPYEEPGIVTILIQSSFLLVLNAINAIFDRIIFCGLLGQVFIGVSWGTPGARWLDENAEDIIVQLGYLGLILLVYEGGLDTNFRSLKANLLLSVAVAITGIVCPMALSFVLQSMVNATPVQAFAASAALCSTSLGTTFTILNTSGLSSTRLGTVLSSAAMMDDVIGLVMVQVISNLGESSTSFNAVTVVRPLAVSAAFAIIVPLVCLFLAQPLTVFLNGVRKNSPDGVLAKICPAEYTAFIIHTLILIGLVTGSTYAGTSNLFASYLAGASVSWWDSEVPHPDTARNTSISQAKQNPVPHSDHSQVTPNPESNTTCTENGINTRHQPSIASSGAEVYHKYYAIAVQRVLKPFFFSSIGFAVPIRDMFSGGIVWRGIVYTVLMLFGKLVTGLWLIRLNFSWPKFYIPKRVRSVVTAPASCFTWMYDEPKQEGKGPITPTNTNEIQILEGEDVRKNEDSAPQTQTESAGESSTTTNPSPALASTPPSPPPPKINKPLSLYPAAMLGTAMTARGEIGFLIASLAETTGLFKSTTEPSSGSSEIYLVVTWAIVLCTIIGPLGVGTLVRRVRRLQKERETTPGVGDPLGIWGVD